MRSAPYSSTESRSHAHIRYNTRSRTRSSLWDMMLKVPHYVVPYFVVAQGNYHRSPRRAARNSHKACCLSIPKNAPNPHFRRNFAISSFRCSISASARVRAARSSANAARKAAISAAGLGAADIMGGSEPEPAPARQPCSSTRVNIVAGSARAARSPGHSRMAPVHPVQHVGKLRRRDRDRPRLVRLRGGPPCPAPDDFRVSYHLKWSLSLCPRF